MKYSSGQMGPQVWNVFLVMSCLEIRMVKSHNFLVELLHKLQTTLNEKVLF